MSDRPGILLYFDDWNVIEKHLPMDQRGELVTALMLFAREGEAPELQNPLTAFAFAQLSQKVARDGESYRQRCIKASYSAYCRECKRRHEEPVSFEQWLTHRTTSNDIVRWETEKEEDTENETEFYMEMHKEIEPETINTNTQKNREGLRGSERSRLRDEMAFNELRRVEMEKVMSYKDSETELSAYSFEED
ncbi:MAG: hypothetical protein IKE62_01175 [Oscillospiraceae bacterium]|nr:hypothetical protein [Oscillospiraceae bacterium]